MQRPGAAERHENEVRWVMTTFNRNSTDRADHVVVSDLNDAFGHLIDPSAQLRCQRAILAALVEVQRTGRGRRIDLALYDCGVTLSAYYGLDALIMKSDPPRYGNAHPSVIPYGVFDAADGPLVIAVGNNRQFKSVCRDVLGRADLADDPRFATNILRSKNRSALIPELERELLKHKRADLLEKLAASGIPCGEVLGLYEALSHPRTEASKMLVTHRNEQGEDIVFTAAPWRIDGERCGVRPPPTLGEHTAEVLASL